MYKLMLEKSPESGYPQGGFVQGGYPQGVSPQGGFVQGGYPQGSYPPQGVSPQGGFPQGVAFQGNPPTLAGNPQGVFPPQVAQGGIPPAVSPQGSYPSPGGYTQGDYSPPQPKFQPGNPNEGYNMPTDPVPADLGEDGDVKGFDFSEKSIRRAFVRKVYAILMTQLTVTLAFVSLFTFHAPTKMWVAQNPLILLIAVVGTLICVIAMACCESVRRQAPTNFIFLGLFTVAESILLGAVSSTFDSEVVMMAVGITAAICLGLTLFAMQTKFDFTVMGGALLCALMVLLLFGLITIFIPKNSIMNLLYASAGAFLFSLYLLYDTQLMMGGQHKYTVSPEEYIFAALNLYLDIINIFLFILRIVAASKS